MKHLNKLLLVFILLPFFSTAQSNYRPGYVVTLNGDTIRGFIDYQDWDSNPTAISFKAAATDKDKKSFTLNDISLFNIDGIAAYKKYSCSISTDATNPNSVIEGRDTSFRIGTVFLKILQTGKNLTLYSYADDLKTRFYIGEAPDYTPTELVYRLYLDREATNVPGNTVNENTYQKQLFALALKYNALDDKLTAILENPVSGYEKANLLKIVSAINHISKADFEKKYAENGKFSFYVSAALDISTTSSGSGSSYSTAGGGSSTSYAPGIGVGVNLVPDPASDKEEFRIELSVVPSSFNSLYTLKVSPYVAARASFDQLAISVAPQVLFNVYNKPNFKFYLGIGLNVSYSTFSNPYFESQASATNPYFPIEPYYFDKFNTSFLLKAGCKINKNMEVFFNYFTPASITGGAYFALSNSVMQVGGSYFFGK